MCASPAPPPEPFAAFPRYDGPGEKGYFIDFLERFTAYLIEGIPAGDGL